MSAAVTSKRRLTPGLVFGETCTVVGSLQTNQCCVKKESNSDPAIVCFISAVIYGQQVQSATLFERLTFWTGGRSLNAVIYFPYTYNCLHAQHRGLLHEKHMLNPLTLEILKKPLVIFLTIFPLAW